MKQGREIIQSRLNQARESLDEAKTLLIQDAEVNFVMNSLYYAFLYPVLGLLLARGITAPVQSAALSLFEDEFVRTGDFDRRFLDAVLMAYDLRPACSCEGKKQVRPEDIEQLLPIAEEFLMHVERFVA